MNTLETTIVVGNQKSALDKVLMALGDSGAHAYQLMLKINKEHLDKITDDEELAVVKNKLSRAFSKITLGVWGYLEARNVKMVNGENRLAFAQRIVRDRLVEDSKTNPDFYTANMPGRKNKKYQDKLFDEIISDLSHQLGGE